MGWGCLWGWVVFAAVYACCAHGAKCFAYTQCQHAATSYRTYVSPTTQHTNNITPTITTTGGQLTEAVRRRPYSVVLLDEVEKAHREVLNVLLGVLDDGRLTDGKGRTVSFANTIIIMTSNVGSDILLAQRDAPGAAREGVMQVIRSTFRPEFLNRLDEIIMFHPLQPEQLRGIAKLQIQQLNARMVDRNIHLQFSDAALEYVVKESYDPSFGARPLRRWLEQHVVCGGGCGGFEVICVGGGSVCVWMVECLCSVSLSVFLYVCVCVCLCVFDYDCLMCTLHSFQYITLVHTTTKHPHQVTKLSRMAVSADLPDNSVVRVNAEGDGGLQYVVHTMDGVAGGLASTNGNGKRPHHNGKRPQYASPEEDDDFDEMDV